MWCGVNKYLNYSFPPSDPVYRRTGTAASLAFQHDILSGARVDDPGWRHFLEEQLFFLPLMCRMRCGEQWHRRDHARPDDRSE